MKIELTFKTPDVLDQWKTEQLQIVRELESEDIKQVYLEDMEDAEAFANGFLQYGEYITVVFDSESKTATVKPNT